MTSDTGETPQESGQDPQADGEDVKAQVAVKPAQGEEFDKERAMALINKLRPIEDQYKKQGKDLTAALAKIKEFEDAKLTEQERIAKQLAESQGTIAALQQRNQELQLRSALTEAARDAGMSRPGKAWNLGDTSGVEYEDGEPTAASLALVVAGIKAELPELFKETDEAAPKQPKNTPSGAPINTARKPNGAGGYIKQSEISTRFHAGELTTKDLEVAYKEGRILTGQ